MGQTCLEWAGLDLGLPRVRCASHCAPCASHCAPCASRILDPAFCALKLRPPQSRLPAPTCPTLADLPSPARPPARPPQPSGTPTSGWTTSATIATRSTPPASPTARVGGVISAVGWPLAAAGVCYAFEGRVRGRTATKVLPVGQEQQMAMLACAGGAILYARPAARAHFQQRPAAAPV